MGASVTIVGKQVEKIAASAPSNLQNLVRGGRVDILCT